jgi:TRAP transporter TAXI family solute receptor
MKKWLIVAFSLVITLSLLVSCGPSEEPTPTPTPTPTPEPGVAWGEPPKDVISISPKHVGSVTYSFAGAIGDAFYKNYGVKVRPIPVGTGTGRFHAVLTGSSDFNCTGADLWQGVQGIFDFASEEWGPQQWGMIWHGASIQCMASRGDSGVDVPAKMAGKRVTWVVGGPASNAVITGYLAYGNITWADVEIVDYPGWSASAYGPVEGSCDIASYSMLGPQLRELQASPGGMLIIQVRKETAEEQAAWARLKEYLPYATQHYTTDPKYPGASADNPATGYFYGHANVCAPLDSDEKLAYFMAKACDETYDEFKKVEPMMEFSSLEMTLNPFPGIPYHPGAVRYFKDKGYWTDELEQHQQESMAEMKAMRDLFEKTLDEFSALPEHGKGEFQAMWEEARDKAGFYIVKFPGKD